MLNTFVKKNNISIDTENNIKNNVEYPTKQSFIYNKIKSFKNYLLNPRSKSGEIIINNSTDTLVEYTPNFDSMDILQLEELISNLSCENAKLNKKLSIKTKEYNNLREKYIALQKQCQSLYIKVNK